MPSSSGSSSGDLVLRPITAAEYPDFLRAESAGFGELVSAKTIDIERTVAEYDRTIAGFDGDDIVATASAYSFGLTVPGGATVAAAGVTGVTVSPTHRRRGILRSMMRRQLDDARQRGDVAAVLYASVASIYGRFGYGLASQHQGVEIDTHDGAFRAEAPVRTLRMLRKEEARSVVAGLYDAYRPTVPGSIARCEPWWRIVLGEERQWKGGGPLFVVVAEPVGDDPGGYVLYDLEDIGDGILKKLVVRELHAATVETEAALWRFCLDHDLARRVSAPTRPLDDPLRWRLANPRQLRVTSQGDYLWLRLLDVVGGLEARSYCADGVVTFELADAFCPELAGTYRLEASGGIGRCQRLPDGGGIGSGGPVDLALSVGELGALYLGGIDASTLARAGQVTERVPGALRRADDLFASDRLPYCTTWF